MPPFAAERPPSDSAALLRSSRSAALLAVLLAALLAAGCGAARAGRFGAFAQAGHAYSVARNGFLEQSLEVAIARDTMELRRQTDVVDDAAQRLRLLTEHDRGMRERMEIIRDLERHGEVRDLYFAALAELAGAKGATRAEGAANALAGQIGSMTGLMAQRTVLGRPVSQLIGQLTGAAVGSFRNRALERHLEAHAATIERELALEEGLLGLLAEEMENDLQALHQARRREQLLAPLRGGDPLSAAWNSARQQLLLSEFDVRKVAVAKQAAAELRQAYQRLTEGEDRRQSLSTANLEFSVERLAGAVASIRSARQAQQ